MRWGGRVAGAAVALLALVLAGCASPVSKVIAGSTITVAYDEPFTSLNATAQITGIEANRELAEAVLAGFTSVDSSGARVPDRSFGTITVLSRHPLAVRYTVADGVRWSDGAPVDAVDLLLAWAAGSGRFPAFDVQRPALGLALASGMPTISEDRKSLTVVYDAAFADYETQFDGVLPAHVVAQEALGVEGAEAAKDALIDTVERAVNGDPASLDDVASWWNTGFSLDAGSGVLLSDGPYRIASVVPGAEVTLVPNAKYAGTHRPTYATIRLVTLDAPSALQGIDAGEVQIASLDATAPTRAAVAKTDPAVFDAGDDAERIVAMARAVVRGVVPGPDGTGLLWNAWAWSPAR